MRNPNLASSMKTLKRFENACFEMAWRGGGDPNDYEIIEDEFKAAKLAARETIFALVAKRKD
jgi:hypothetical protein